MRTGNWVLLLPGYFARRMWSFLKLLDGLSEDILLGY
jgi:hypothetical protein